MTKHAASTAPIPLTERDGKCALIIKALSRQIEDHFSIRYGQGAPVAEYEAALLAEELLKTVQNFHATKRFATDSKEWREMWSRPFDYPEKLG